MASYGNLPLSLRGAENIALLHLFHKVPVEPSINISDDSRRKGKTYPLDDVQEERKLTGIFAFLSSIEDDPDHIPAVCLQQHKSQPFEVLLAVNKKSPNDGTRILETTKTGFEAIVKVLARVGSAEDSGTIKADLLAEIVAMCSKRIRCRLKLLPKKRLSKADAERRKGSFQTALQKAINYISKLPQDIELVGSSDPSELPDASETSGSSSSPPSTFVKRAKNVVQRLNAWMNHQVDTRLVNIVEAVHKLDKVKNIRSLIRGVPNDILAPDSRHSLINVITKVARYKESSRTLYSRAKSIPQLRNMKVVIVKLPQECWQKPCNLGLDVDLQSTVLRAGAPKQYSLDLICRYLELDQEGARQDFEEQTRSTLTDGKFHAEIQILYFCEVQQPAFPPRVVCSSKDACFLCNAFIAAHKKWHTPRSHGKLYPGWRVPKLSAMAAVEEDFNQLLEAQVKQSLRLLMHRRERTHYNEPAESTIMTLVPSCSTLRERAQSMLSAESKKSHGEGRAPSQVQLSVDHATVVADPTPRDVDMDSVVQEPNLVDETLIEIVPPVAPAEDKAKGPAETVIEVVPSHSCPSSPVRSTADTSSSTPVSELIDVVKSGILDTAQESQWIDLGDLGIQLCCPAMGEPIAYQARKLLRPRQVDEKLRSVDITDLEYLDGEVVRELDDGGSLYLRHAGQVVQLRLRYMDAALE